MTDAEIVSLFLSRDEEAIAQSKKRYDAYLLHVAKNVTIDERDAEECVDDALMAAWNSIPPQTPENLKAYLGKLTREIAIDRLRSHNAQKRGSSEAEISFEELEGVLSEGDPTDRLIGKELAELISRFLREKKDEERRIFIRRYWYFDSIEEICRLFRCRKSRVKMLLKRTRDELSEYLKKEGYNR